MNVPEHALLVALDIVDFSGRGQPGGKRPMDDHQDLQQGLYEAFRAACRRADLAPAASDVEDRGDGMHVLFADPVEPARLVADLPRELTTALEPFNRRRERGSRLRVRLAVHDGYVRREPYPWQGDSIIKLVRLLNCPAAGAQLVAHPDQVLAVTISDPIYQAAVEECQRGLKPADFAPVTIQHDEQSRPFPAWLRVPNEAPREPGDAAVAEAAPSSQPNPPGSRTSTGNRGNQTMGDQSHIYASARDVHVTGHR